MFKIINVKNTEESIMSAKGQALKITFDESIVNMLTIMAKQENKSLEDLARELIVDALERKEEVALSALAESRDAKKVKRIKHEDA